MVSPPGPMGYGVWLFEVCAHSKVGTPAPHCSLSSIAGAPKANKSMPGKGSTLQCQPVSSGPKKSWRPIELWHLHDSEWPGCASPMRVGRGPSWRSRRPCRARWRSCWATRRRSLRTPGVAWLRHLRSCWSAAQSRWLHLRLAEQRRSARSWPDLPLLISEVCSLHQDQVVGVGSRIQAD